MAELLSFAIVLKGSLMEPGWFGMTMKSMLSPYSCPSCHHLPSSETAVCPQCSAYLPLLYCFGFFSSADTSQACDSYCPLPAIASSRMISLGHCHLCLLVPNFWREDFSGEVKRAHGCLLSKWPPHIMIMKVKPL